MNKGDSKFELSELFMAAADRDRRFFGTIKRGFDLSGHPVVWGRIEVNTGFICAMEANVFIPAMLTPVPGILTPLRG